MSLIGASLVDTNRRDSIYVNRESWTPEIRLRCTDELEL